MKQPREGWTGYLEAVANLYAQPEEQSMDYEFINTEDLFESETKMQQARRVITEYTVCSCVLDEIPDDMALVLSQTLVDLIAYAELLEEIAFGDMTVGELQGLRKEPEGSQ